MRENPTSARTVRTTTSGLRKKSGKKAGLGYRAFELTTGCGDAQRGAWGTEGNLGLYRRKLSQGLGACGTEKHDNSSWSSCGGKGRLAACYERQEGGKINAAHKVKQPTTSNTNQNMLNQNWKARLLCTVAQASKREGLKTIHLGRGSARTLCLVE